MTVLGRRWFALVLMHRMKDLNSPRVEQALAELGASRAELRAAHAQWVQMAYSAGAPHGPDAFRVALGPPHDVRARPFGDLCCTIERWHLPAWPDLQFEILLGPGGTVWNQWLVRPGAPASVDPADLQPWSAVIGDVAAGCPAADLVEGSAPHHWSVDFDHSGHRHRARFVHGLLQVVQPAPGGGLACTTAVSGAAGPRRDRARAPNSGAGPPLPESSR